MDRIPLYLAALCAAIMQTPTRLVTTQTLAHRAATWFLSVPPPRTIAGAVTRAIRRVLAYLWVDQRPLVVATAVLCVMVLMPGHVHAHAGVGVAVIVGQINIAQLETDLRAKQVAAKTLLETTMRACQDHIAKAATASTPEEKGRLMTPEEKGAIQAFLDEAKAIKARIEGAAGDANLMAEIERLTAGMASGGSSQAQPRVPQSLGAQFISDPAYRAFIKAQGHRSRQFTSPTVELQATTLDTTAGSGGPLIVPDYRPGIIPLLFRRLVVADLIAPGTTDGNLISFMKEKTFTNAAAAVAQGGTKQESTLVYEAATAAVKKIAHWIPTTTEMLEDFAQTMSLIDARLRLGVDLAEEDELLNGTGIGEHQLGLNALTGLTAAQARGADSNMDAIFKQITAIATTVFVQPDGVIMNPINWQTIQLLKNAAGNYMGSGPWAPAQSPTLWGLPIAVTPAEAANSALVGAYRQCAQFFRKGGVRVETSNSHANFFIENKVAILAEERGALAVYREAAFGKVTGLN